jgi:uncharacterized protein
MTVDLEANKALVHKFMSLIRDGYPDEALKHIDKDAVWWGAGGSMTPAQLMEISKLVRPYLEAPIDFQLGITLAEGNYVAMEAKSSATRTNGKVFNNSYFFLFTVENGLITSVREHQDTRHAAEVWGDLYNI